MIHMIIMFQIVENTRLKNYECTKIIQVMIRTVILILVEIF